MPPHPDTPEPLKTALTEMETSVQEFKKRIAYQAPEQHDALWITLQQELAGTLSTMYLDLTAEPVEKKPVELPKMGDQTL